MIFKLILNNKCALQESALVYVEFYNESIIIYMCKQQKSNSKFSIPLQKLFKNIDTKSYRQKLIEKLRE